MPTRNIVVTQPQADFIERMVEEGRYQNASEVLREGLRLVQTREAEDAARLQALRDAIQLGVDALERGDFVEFASFNDLDAHLRTLGKAARRRAASEA